MLRIALVLSTLVAVPSSSLLGLRPVAQATATTPVAALRDCSCGASRAGKRVGRQLQLRGGGSGDIPELVVPDSFDTLENVLAVFAVDKAATEAQVIFRAGNHSIGTAACNGMGVLLDSDTFRLRVRGEEGTTLAGCWRIEGGGGQLEHARLLDLALLANCDYDGEFLHPGIMYGDCCIAVTSSLPWLFRDCEVQCSGTALRAYDDADVTCERFVTGGSSLSKLPPSNIHEMSMAPWLKQLMIESMDTRNKTTGLALYPESSMPRYGITAWGRARIKMIDCSIINMTLNGVCASDNTSVEIHGSSISGSGMAGLYLEG